MKKNTKCLKIWIVLTKIIILRAQSISLVMKKLFIYFLLCPIQLFCQNISGTITDSKTNLPIEFATVYINGTTIGTISDKNGNFTIGKFSLPCQMVVSHISYIPIVIPLDENSHLNPGITLNPRVIELGQVSVKEQNRRKENIKQFKDEFFGVDVWGRNVILKNENDLIFKTEYFEENDSNAELIENQKSFNVESKAPLKIALPLLGYDLQVDLIKFSKHYNPALNSYEINILGYYFFKPFEPNSKIKVNKYNRNRLDAYYNSSQHFCRSLYDNKLRENGYLVFEFLKNDDPKVQRIRKEFKLDSCLIYNGVEANITGLKNRNFFLNYYYNRRGYPINLNNRNEGEKKMSRIYFLYDECIIRKDGTRPGESITFGGSIALKRIGSYLPSDYYPDN